MLTQERLKELLHYDPDTGVFTWKVAAGRRVRVGSVAGYHDDKGYIRIGIDGRAYRAHRLAFLYMCGAFPPAEVDHIDHCESNNRWGNLRMATAAENQKNTVMRSKNTSGYKGVVWDKLGGNWRARAALNGRLISLGSYPTAEAASAAYEDFARKHHGEFYHQTRAISPNVEVV